MIDDVLLKPDGAKMFPCSPETPDSQLVSSLSKLWFAISGASFQNWVIEILWTPPKYRSRLSANSCSSSLVLPSSRPKREDVDFFDGQLHILTFHGEVAQMFGFYKT